MTRPGPDWHVVLQKCVQLSVLTGCVVAVLLALASDPSWDELQKGVPASVLAGVASWLAGWYFRVDGRGDG